MSKQHRYNFAKSGKGRALDRLLAIAVLVAVAFVLWKFSRPAKTAKKSPKPVKPGEAQVEISKEKVIIPAAAVRTAVAPPGPAIPGLGVPLPESPVAVGVAATNAPVAARRYHDLLEAQVVLARQGISCGSLDGVLGSQTRAALRAFQRKLHLPETGALDTNTRPALLIEAPALTAYTVTSNDLARLQPLGKTWLAKSQQTALDYDNALELVAEKAHAHPSLIRRLNPGVNWTNLFADTVVTVPDAAYPAPAGKAAFAVISLSEKTLEAFDESTNLLLHFPCSIARRVEKRPAGELHVVAIAPNPNYTFDPEVFPEEPEAKAIGHKLIIPPGPNNPVGTAWISLDLPGYGMHGTPKPEDVGRTESHGCFRLANWNAEYLIKFVWVGMPVRVVP